MFLFIISTNNTASLIFLGVFDKDQLGDHDPIGRVVINLSNFRESTVYLLDYSLHSDPNKEDDRGKITVRLRVEWMSKNKQAKHMFQKPPRKIFLNVASSKSFHLVKYLVRGKVDMEKASMDSVLQYKTELWMHYDNLFHLVVDIFNVLLWRGRLEVCIRKPIFLLASQSTSREKKVSWQSGNTQHNGDGETMKLSLWFPIESMVLFQTAIAMIEYPRCVPGLSFIFFGLVMLRFMILRCQNPIPWKRCKVSGIHYCQIRFCPSTRLINL